MPKRCVSGVYNNTNEDGYSTDKWPKDSEVAHKWDRFVKLDRINWKPGYPSDVLCGSHFRQHDDHSDFRDYISDTTCSYPRMHAWRVTRFVCRFHVSFKF